MFGVLPDDHRNGLGLKDNIARGDAKKTGEATTVFEGNVPQAVKNNFFIDASYLLDESEVKDVQNNKCSDSNDKPPPFIRRKTFELEADDDKVATLRQEYERRQGSALFQTSSVEAPSSLPLGILHRESLVDNDVQTPDSLNNDGFEEASDKRPGSAPCEEEDPNKNELVSPTPSPIGDYVHIHKDSIDAGTVLEDEGTDSEERVDNKIDVAPLVSGGVVPEKVQSPMFSRRRTECAPILSGAAPPPEPVSPESSNEEKPRNLSASSAWVVDISDIVSSPETRRKKQSKSLSSSLGYFVDLKGSASAAMQRSGGNTTATSVRIGNSACARDAGRKNIFLSSDKGSMESCIEKAASQESSLGIKPSIPKVVHSPEQKMFTMFIGLNKEEQCEPSCRRKIVEDKPTLFPARKQGVYMYIGSESPRESPGESPRESPPVNWKAPDREGLKKQHVRAKSLSTSDTAVIPDRHSQPASIQQHNASVGNFVRLSDLDKAPKRLTDSEKFLSSHRGTENITSFTMENKTKSWGSKTTGPNCSESLVRLIPTIKNLSSSTFHGMEEESQDDENTPKEFWQDLKHVFVNNLCTDLIVEVAGRRIGAHKIVLTNRCPYFAAALSGGWVESGGNVIRLRGFSYPAVHFALYHIYIGTLTIPENISIVELAMLCDLFHLDSLKETVELELAKKLCHSFHDPPSLKCACMPGTLETLVLAASYNLEYLYPKCLQWSSIHFYKVCQTAPFLTLPNELKDKILKSIVNHSYREELTKEEALELKVFTAVNTTRLLAWADRTDLARSSVSWFHRLRDETHKVVAKSLNTLLSNSASFHLLVRDTVDAVVLYSVQFSTPEELCLVYRILFLSHLENCFEKYPEGAKDVLGRLLDSAVLQLVSQASKVVRTRAWNLLDDSMQAPILEKAGFPRRRQDGPLQRSATTDKNLPVRNRLFSGGSHWESIAAALTPAGNRLQNLRHVKQVIAQHVNGANQGTLDPVPLRRSAVPVAATVKRREVKSRYLEIKSRPMETKTADTSVSQRHSYCAPATGTSSDSSAITPTECLSDAAGATTSTTKSATAATAATHKRKGRPTSAPVKQTILPRRCASSSAVPAKARLSAPPMVATAVPARTKKTTTSSTSTSASASAPVSAPTSASTSFSAKKLGGPVSRLNIPLRTCRSSSSVPQATSSVAIRKDILKTAESAVRRGVSTQPKNQMTPLKPLNGPRVRPVNGPPKGVNGPPRRPDTRTVGCETNDLNSKPRTRTPLSVSRVRNGVASTSAKSTSDVAIDTSDIIITSHDGNNDDDELSSSKPIVLASRSGTFLKDEPSVLRNSDKS